MNGETYYIDTKDISLQQTNAINQYIAETLAYSHSEITDSVEKSFEQSAYKTSDSKPRGIIIHDTGVDDSTIQSEVNYMVQNYDEKVFLSILSSTTLPFFVLLMKITKLKALVPKPILTTFNLN